MDRIPIRVVVPCRHADATIEKCIGAIMRSQGPAREIVIVDDGDNRVLDEVATRYCARIVRTTGSIGAGAARNFGSAGFCGDILVFIDADVEVADDALALLTAPIFSGQANAAVGRYSEQVKGRRFPEAYKQLYLAFTYQSGNRFLENTFWTALGAVSTKFFHDVGGFADHFYGAGPEDIDLGVKLTRGGAKIIAVPNATGQHLASIGFFGLFANDLRKGSEDIYIHWRRSVPLKDNRHVSLMDIAAVILSWVVMILFFIPTPKWLLIMAVMLLYLALRGKLLTKAYLPAGMLLFLSSVPVTFVLDVVRGLAVAVGTALASMEVASKGRWKPFVNPKPMNKKDRLSKLVN